MYTEIEDEDTDNVDAPPRAAPAAARRAVTLERIDAPRNDWLWTNRIAVGHLTLVAGASGGGKSLFAADLAARVSSGAAWPGETNTRPAGKVLFAQSHRHENGVLKRRLLAAGADERRIAVVTRPPIALGTPPGTLARKLVDAIEKSLDDKPGVSLVVIDHVQSWLGPARMSGEEQAALLTMLEDLAAWRQIALVALWRLEKGVRGGQTRTLDALAAEAPLVWLLAPDAYCPEAHLAVCAQNRLGNLTGNLPFHIEDGRLLWQIAARQTTADEVLATRTIDRHERRQAGEWLLDILAQGPLEAKRLFEEMRRCGLAERTVRRAAAELNLHPQRDGKSGTWFWHLRTPAGVEPSRAAAVTPDPGETPNMAALPEADSLAPAMVQVELRRDAAPNVAALLEVGSLATSEGVR